MSPSGEWRAEAGEGEHGEADHALVGGESERPSDDQA